MPIAPHLVAELNAHIPGAIRRGDVPVDRCGREHLATGFAALDTALGGGLPRGHLSELVGPASTGVTSLVQRFLGHVTGQAHLAAWIDAPDAFDPASAVAAGVDLERVLWVRPPDLATAFVATEALLAMGGFPLVLLDASLPLRHPGKTPGAPPPATASTWREPGRGRDLRMADALHVWLRLARAAARARSALVVLQRGSRRAGARGGLEARPAAAGASAAVRLELEPLRVLWDRSGGAPTLLDGLVARVVVARNRAGQHGEPSRVVLELR